MEASKVTLKGRQSKNKTEEWSVEQVFTNVNANESTESLALDGEPILDQNASSPFILPEPVSGSESAIGAQSQIPKKIKKKKRQHAHLKPTDKITTKAMIPYFMRLLLSTQVDRNEELSEESLQNLEGSENEAGEYSTVKFSKGQFIGDNEYEEDKYDDEDEPFHYEPEVLPTEAAAAFYLASHKSRRGGLGKTDEGVDEALHRRWSRTVWRREIDNLEPEYRLPALILKKHLYIKNGEPARLGPGTYDADYDDIIKKKRFATTRGVMNSCSRRFPKEVIANQNPGPGTYGYPYGELDRAEREGIHGGRITLFQSGPCDVRAGTFGGKISDAFPGPGHYQYKQSIDQLLHKQISTRGPYDLYTPDRDVIPYGYSKTIKINPDMGPGKYDIRHSLRQYWNFGFNKYKGRFSPHARVKKVTGERISLVSPLWPIGTELFPGPGQYDMELDSIGKDKKQNKYGFQSSADARPKEVADYDMSPTKYRPELGPIYCPLGCGHKSVFKSTTGRLDLIKMPVLAERVRPKDLPPEEYGHE